METLEFKREYLGVFVKGTCSLCGKDVTAESYDENSPSWIQHCSKCQKDVSGLDLEIRKEIFEELISKKSDIQQMAGIVQNPFIISQEMVDDFYKRIRDLNAELNSIAAKINHLSQNNT